jgi:hypothetical protein
MVVALSLAGSVRAAVPPRFSTSNSLPPSDGVYVTPAQWHAAYANGIVIRDVSHNRFTQNLPAPPLGATQTHTFGSTLSFQLSTDGGATFQPASGFANVSVIVTHTKDVGGESFYDTEMIALDLTSGSLMVRESPTLPSLGQTTIQPVAGGFLISSFFDIFTEVSLDGGQTWTPAQQAAHVELRTDPAGVPPIPTPSPLVPPPNDVYVSPATYHALFAQGIVLKDVRHKFFTLSSPLPPPGGTETETFGSQLDMQLSTDGGNTYRYVRAPATVQVQVTSLGSSSNTLYDTEMLGLSFSVPGTAVMVRESPTLPSRGQTQVMPQSDGTYRISSFFDIFTELSLDGGATWSSASNGPVRVQLQQSAPEQSALSPNLPVANGQYVSPLQWEAVYANGIIISNVSNGEFTKSQPPPGPGATIVQSFNSQVSLLYSTDGGLTFTPYSGNAAAQVQVSNVGTSGGTTYYDTEMLQFNVSGGTLPPAVMIRESPSKASLGRTSIRTAGTGPPYRISSFFDVFTELSVDGGITWSPSVTLPGTVQLKALPAVTPLTVTCPPNITVTGSGPAGAIVNYPPPLISGGCQGALITSETPPSGSVFPVGTSTVNVSVIDSCGLSNGCGFTVTVNPQTLPIPEYFFNQPVLPPTNGVYITPAAFHAAFANGIVIRDVRHRAFTQNFTAPALNATEIHSFGSTVDFEFSTDNGTTFQPATGSANVSVRLTRVMDSGGQSFFDTEMLALNLTSSALRIRESPTLASHGQTTSRPVPGGYMISSFFDIFSEVSMDNGLTWTPAQQAAHVELRTDPNAASIAFEPSSLLPPPNDTYVSPALYHALYAQGIVIKDVRHKFFTQSVPPPNPGQTISESFGSQLDLQLSMDGGNSFQYVRAPAAVQVPVTGQGSSVSGLYDTEMLGLNFSVPGTAVMVRESPTLPSRGETQVAPLGDGRYVVSSFFDIFTELSLDGGATWSPASYGPVRMQLQQLAPEQMVPNPNLPPTNSEYITPQQWHAAYANGIVISNVSHRQFTSQSPLPPPGVTNLETFNSLVTLQVSRDGGKTFQSAIGTAPVAVQVASAVDTGNTRFFDTEMLSLNLTIPSSLGSIMVRESPTKASLGRTSVRANGPTDFRVSSFFDVFTEVSLDGGTTWSPNTNGPATVRARSPVGGSTFGIQCPADITVAASNSAGATVTFFVGTFGGCGTPAFTFASPSSGSVFPVGTSTVTVSAVDPCGNSNTCTFHVTVKPYVKKHAFGTQNLPPLNGQYVSPAQWHALYANGIILSNAVHRRFLQSFPPPGPSTTNTHSFGSQVNFLYSTDSGKTFQPVTGSANVIVSVGNNGTQGSDQVYETEMLALDLNGGAVRVRESPTLASLGETRIQTGSTGGFMISSFFDVFTELSLDGGATWSPSTQPTHVELQVDPGAAPTTAVTPQMQGGNFSVSVATQPGLTYLEQYTDDLANPTWFNLIGVLGNGSQSVLTDYLTSGASRRYYRFLVLPTPPQNQ